LAKLRTEKVRGFTTIDNDIFRNKTLSLKAKGLLCLMISLPDGWNYSIAGLSALSSDGESSVRSALKELKEKGYFYRRQVRENGRIADIEYVICEEPFLVDENLVVEKQQVENQVVENQVVEKRPQLNTNTLNTKESNTKKSKETVQDVLEMIPEELRETAEAFVEHRKKLKAPMTGHALELAIKKAKKLANDDLDTTIAIMEQSIENGWKGIFELKDKKKERGWMNDVQRMDDDCSGSMFDIYE